MGKNKIVLFALPILAIFLISIVSAQTIIVVAGKVSNEDYSQFISGASVNVTCNGNLLTTISLDDGTFAVGFDLDKCSETSSPSIAAAKAGFSNLKIADVVIKIDPDTLPLVNTNNDDNNNNNGGGGSYYFCGNGRCDSGENERTCPRDCKSANTIQTNAAITTIQTTAQNETSGEETGTEDKGFFSGITGAVIGALGAGGAIAALIFIIVIIALAIIVAVMRKKAG